MTSQQLLNLEYLQRATDPRLPESERQAMLESLGYSMATDDAANDWVFSTFSSVRPDVLPDAMLLWVADWAESLSRDQVTSEIHELIAKLWQPHANQITQARLFECAATLDQINGDSPQRQMPSATDRIFSIAMENRSQDEGLDSILALLDMVLARADTKLLSGFAARLRDGGLSSQPQIIQRIERRLALLPEEFRSSVAREFEMEPEQ